MERTKLRDTNLTIRPLCGGHHCVLSAFDDVVVAFSADFNIILLLVLVFAIGR